MHPYSHSRSYKWLVRRVFYCVLICQLCAVLISDIWFLNAEGTYVTLNADWRMKLGINYQGHPPCLCLCLCRPSSSGWRARLLARRWLFDSFQPQVEFFARSFFVLRTSCFVLRALCFVLRTAVQCTSKRLSPHVCRVNWEPPRRRTVTSNSSRAACCDELSSWPTFELSNHCRSFNTAPRHADRYTLNRCWAPAWAPCGPTLIVYCTVRNIPVYNVFSL